MPLVKFTKLGEVGVINDLPHYAIPVNALSDGMNVRMDYGVIRNFGGHQVMTTPPIEPYGLFLFQAPDRTNYWIEAGLTAVYVYNGSIHTDISRTAPYTMQEYFDRWTGGIQHTMGFLCNGHADGPQVWPQIDIGTPLVDMTYDPTAGPGSRTWEELSYTAYSMRPFKDTIVAMNIRRGASQLPSTVQWCEFIAPGTTEPDWVPRTTNNAGEVAIGETTGNIIDGAPMRDDFIIYKEDAAYRMSFTGVSGSPFAFERLPDYVRIINRNCVGVAEEMHVCASRDDVQVFDGNVFRSILDGRMRDYYQTTMFADRLFTTFVAVLDTESEVWICFPSQGDIGEMKSPDRAIVWNYKTNTISLTDLPQCRDMDQGVIVEDVPDTFDDNTMTFDEDYAPFDESPFQKSREYLAGAHGTNVSVFGESATDAGQPRTCMAERTGLVLQDGRAGYQSSSRVHTVRSIRPNISGTGAVNIQVGASMSSDGPVFWEPEQSYNPDISSELNVRATGRYFGWRVRSLADIRWALSDVEFEYQLRRKR